MIGNQHLINKFLENMLDSKCYLNSNWTKPLFKTTKIKLKAQNGSLTKRPTNKNVGVTRQAHTGQMSTTLKSMWTFRPKGVQFAQLQVKEKEIKETLDLELEDSILEKFHNNIYTNAISYSCFFLKKPTKIFKVRDRITNACEI